LLALLPRMDIVKGWLFAIPGGSRALKHVMAILFGNKLHWFESSQRWASEGEGGVLEWLTFSGSESGCVRVSECFT